MLYIWSKGKKKPWQFSFWNSEPGAWRKELMSSSWNQYGYQTWTSSSPTYWKADAESTITRNSTSKVTVTVTNAVTPLATAAAAIAAAAAREREQTTKKSCPRQTDQGIVSCKLTSTANLFFCFPWLFALYSVFGLLICNIDVSTRFAKYNGICKRILVELNQVILQHISLFDLSEKQLR